MKRWRNLPARVLARVARRFPPSAVRLLGVGAVASTVLVASSVPVHGDDRLPNWPVRPSRAESLFASQDFRIEEARHIGAGVTGAMRLAIRFDDGTPLKAKWKPVPRGSADGWNNSPRKEMAAYALHRLFIDEDDAFVPTLALHCIPVEEYRVVEPDAEPNIDGASCVLGVIAVWLDDVTVPHDLWDRRRFLRDSAYAARMADLNVFGYLAEHRDGRAGNILVSVLPGDPRVFAVDNGIAFAPFPWNFFVRNWNSIRVPWLRRATVDRLSAISHDDLSRLGVVAEMEMDDAGRLRPVTPGPSIDRERGVRRSGRRLQFGLDDDELEGLKNRLDELLEEIDEGDVKVH